MMRTTNNSSSQPINNDNFLGRIILWAFLGSVCGLRGSKLIACAVLGPLGEKALGFTLQDALAEWQRQREEHERRERLRQLFQNLAAHAIKQGPSAAKDKPETVPLLCPSKPVTNERDSKWLEIIRHPSVVLVVGKRGSGKSALGYRLLEVLRYRLVAYVLSIPAHAQNYCLNG